jgi:hypothetical protein
MAGVLDMLMQLTLFAAVVVVAKVVRSYIDGAYPLFLPDPFGSDNAAAALMDTLQTPAGTLSVWRRDTEPPTYRLTVEHVDFPKIYVGPADASRGLRTGSRDFDEAFAVDGPPGALLPAIDQQARKRMLSLADGQLALEGRVLSFVGPDNETSRHALVALGTLLLRTPQSLRAEIVASDPLPAVRMLALEQVLADRSLDSDAVHDLLSDALTDSSPAIRRLAARKKRAFDVLIQLVNDPHVSVETASGALLDLHTIGAPIETLRPVAQAAWARPETALRNTALRILNERQDDSLLDQLTSAPADPLIGGAIAYLRAVGGHRTEAVLHDWLRGPQSTGTTRIIRALGEVGSAASVAVLRAHAASNPSTDGLQQEAIRRIHVRLGGATPGRVSLPTSDASQGQVMIAPEAPEPGRVALPTQDTRPAPPSRPIKT